MRSTILLALLLVAGAARAQTPALPPQALEISRLLRVNQLDRAVATGEAWSAAEPTSALAFLWVGRTYAREALAAGILSKASWAGKTRAAYEKAVALDGGLIDARFELMQYYVMAPGFMGGDDAKAKQQAQAIAALDPVRGHVANATIALDAKDEAGAERELRAAVAMRPGDARIYFPLAAFLANKKRWTEVRALYGAALAMNPSDPVAHYQLGRAAALSGEELEAGLKHLDTYLALPDHPDDLPAAAAQWRRAQVLEKLGRKDDAIAALRTALQMEPSLEDAKKDLARLGG